MSSSHGGAGQELPNAESLPVPGVVEGELLPLGAGVDLDLVARLYRIKPEDTPGSGTPKHDVVLNAIRANPGLLIAAYVNEHRAARTDSMTGLLNRQAFHERFLGLSESQLAVSGIFALMILDVDGFKTVNEKSGYAEGDRLLKALARKLRAADLLFRIGGDEYAALLVDGEPEEGKALLSPEERLSIVEQRMVQDAREVFAEEFPKHPRLDLSIGSVARSEELGPDVTPQVMFALANGALKLVKKANVKEARKRAKLRVRTGRFIGRTGYIISSDYDPRIMP